MATSSELTQAIMNYQSTGSPSNIDNGLADVQMPIRKHLLADEDYVPSARDIIMNYSQDYTPHNLVEEAAAAGWGESRYDAMTGFNPNEDIEEMRALAQPNAWKIGNGIIKGGVTAATTAANTVAGTIAGLGSAAFELAKQVNNSVWHGEEFDAANILDAGVNNFLSEQLIALQNLSEELFPNYRTQEERSDEYQRQWIRHLGTANFIGDSLIKNFGFTVGAMAGGMVWSNLIGKALSKTLVNDLMKGATVAAAGDKAAYESLIKAAKSIPTKGMTAVDVDAFTGNLRNAAKAINRSKAILQVSGATIGAIGEGNMEGLMARKEFIDAQLPELRRRYQAQIDAVNDELLNSGDSKYVTTIGIGDQYGIPHDENVLTQEGQMEAIRRKQELMEKMRLAEANLEDEGDRLASWTFALNLPVLTGSNLVQFGRMFSGGWKTARTAAKVSGKLGNYRGILENLSEKQAAALLGTANALKVAGSEAFEEMAQGFISSGAQNAAEENVTQFNDDGYDDEATGRMRSWWENWFEGGTEYLSDWKNWQEGFMGAVTGLFGMPGRGYFSGDRGGIPGAIREAKEDVHASREAARKLNEIVNDPKFRENWENHIRHLKYDIDMEKALAEDNQYAWHDSNDKQMISDVIAFARAGKLDDLRGVVDNILSMTGANADEIRQVKDGTDPTKQVSTKNKSDEDVVKDVKKPAQSIRDVIDEYEQVYDALQTLAPADADDKMLEEMAFTALNLKALEKRFVTMLDEVRASVEPVLKEKSKRGEGGKFATKEKADEMFDAMRERFDILMSRVLPAENEAEINKDNKDGIAKLKSYLGDMGSEMNAKLDDMIKIAEDRRKFYKKFNDLRNMTGAQYSEKAMTPEKKQEQINKEQVKKDAETFKSIDDIKSAYRQASANKMGKEFFDTLRDISSTNPAAKDFLDLYDAYQDFLNYYQNSQYVIDDVNTNAKTAEGLMLQQMFDDAKSVEDFLDFAVSFDAPDSAGTMVPGKRVMDRMRAAASGPIPEPIIARSYNMALTAIGSALADYNSKRSYVSGRNQQKKQASMPTSSGASPASAPAAQSDNGSGGPNLAMRAGLNRKGRVKGGEQDSVGGQKQKDKLGREFEIGQKVYMYKLDQDGEVTPFMVGEYTVESFFTSGDKSQMRISNGSSSKFLIDLNADDVVRIQTTKRSDDEPARSSDDIIVKDKTDTEDGDVEVVDQDDNTEEERKAYYPDGDEEKEDSSVKHYYRTGMPEIDSKDAKRARKIIRNLRLKIEEKIAAIRGLKLMDFGQKNPNYKPTFDKLSNFVPTGQEGDPAQNAFDNVARVVEVGDKLEFCIDSKFDVIGNDGKPQVLVYTVKNGKKVILSTLGYQVDQYENLGELRKAIEDRYAAWKEAGHDATSEVFVFSDDNGKPYQSTVWSKRNGIVLYKENSRANKWKNELPITQIPAYDKNAPIVFINRNGDQIQLSGDEYDEKYLNNLASIGENHGNLYYLAKGRNGYSIPIRLNVEHYTKQTAAYSSPIFASIKSAIKNMSDVAQKFAANPGEDLDVMNSRLSQATRALGENLDIHELVFRFVKTKDGVPFVRVFINDKAIAQSRSFDLSKFTPEIISDFLIGRGLPIRISSSTHIQSLIDSDVITSNAHALRPKGVDIYYYRWTGDGFEKYQTQEQIAKENTPEDESTEAQAPTRSGVKKAAKDTKEKSMGKIEKPTEPVKKAENPSVVAANVINSEITDASAASLVAEGINIAASKKKLGRLSEAVRMLEESDTEDGRAKAMGLIARLVTTKEEYDKIISDIAKKNGLDEDEIDEIDDIAIFEWMSDMEAQLPEELYKVVDRIAQMSVYGNTVQNAISALSGKNPGAAQSAETQPGANVDFTSMEWDGLTKVQKESVVDSIKRYQEAGLYPNDMEINEDTAKSIFNNMSPDGKKRALKCS